MRRLFLLPLPLAALAYAPAVLAQTAPVPAPADAAALPEAEDDGEVEDAQIVVTARRIAGSFTGPEKVVAELNEEEIASYGASSLQDLLTALAPQTGSGRGRGGGGGFPIMLVNGQRIANFREIRSIPPEAIRKVEVLPEEVALRYGYPPNQRVVNLILKPNFAVSSVDVEYGGSTHGGSAKWEAEASTLRITGPSRTNITARGTGTSGLTEAERGVIQQNPPLPGEPDPAQFRSLIGDSHEYSLNGTWSSGLGEEASAGNVTLNATVTKSDNRSLSGLNLAVLTPGGPIVADPLDRRSRTLSSQASAGLNKPLGDWQLAATIDAGRSETRTWTDRRSGTVLTALGQAGQDFAEVDNDNLSSLVTFTGTPLRLPAGEVSTTIKGGFGYTGIRSSNTSSPAGPVSLKRGDLSGGLTLGLPIASRREGVLDAIGDLNLNLSAGVNRLSDFGTLKDWSAGLVWAPLEKLSLQASYLYNEAAPSLGELGNPQIVRFNVPVYDFTRGETALVSVTSGGNPALRQETQKDIKIGAYWQLPILQNSNLMAEYFRNRSNDVTSSFPLLTPAIEAAFPDRVTRDANGVLTALDARSITLFERETERLRWGFNLSGPFGKANAAPQGGPGGRPGMGGGRPGGWGGGPGARPPGAGAGGGRPGGPGGFGGGGFGGFGGGGDGRGRWNLSLYHTVQFTDRVTVAPGGPVLDLLDGDALSGGGTARHGLEMDSGIFYRGFGLRANGNFSAPTTIRSTGGPGATDLRFGSVFKVDLRAFVNFDQQAKVLKAMPFLKGTRLALEIDNLFDQRQRVTDDSGLVPISYQPDLIDPVGRFIGIDIRKAF